MGIGGVVVNFTARTADAVRDITKFTRTAQDADRELEGLDRSLSDVQSEFDRTGAKARSVDGDMQRAETAFDSLAREVDQTVDRVSQDMRRMGGAVKGGADDAHREASRMRGDLGEVGKESGAEFISNIAEGIGSGSGSLQDVVSGTLGGLTNLAATMTGPVALAGAAAAAGIGLLFNKVKGEAEEAKARVDDIVAALEGVTEETEEALAEAAWNTWLSRIQESPDDLRKITKAIKMSGIEQETFRDAITGSKAAQDEVYESITKTVEELYAQKFAGEALTPAQVEYLANADDVLSLIEEQTGDLSKAKGIHEDINYLQGEQKQGQKDVTKEVNKTTDAVMNLDDEWDKASQDRTMKIKIEEIYSRGGAWGASPTGGMQAATMAAAAAQPVVIQPTVVQVTEEQIYRAVHQLLLRGDARNGRPVRIA